MAIALSSNIKRLNANETQLQYQNFEVFSSVLEKDHPDRKFPLYDYAPTIIQEGNLFKMWWLGRSPNITSDPAGDNVFYAESANGINWSEPISVLTPPHHDPTVYGYYVGNPSVIKIANTYHMYISAGNRGKSPLGETIPANAIGYTTSEDGIHWTDLKIIKEPFSVSNKCCGGYGAGEPSVVFRDGLFYMAYIDTTGRASNPVNGSGIYMLRSPVPDFSTDTLIVTNWGALVPLTEYTDTKYLWKDNINGGEFAWSDALNKFAYLPGGTSRLWLAKPDLQIVQSLDFPIPKNGWREENTFVRTEAGHVVDLDASNGIDFFVLGGYVTSEANQHTQNLPGALDIWWTDFQAVKLTLLQGNESIGDRLALRIKQADNGCPQDYQQIALMARMPVNADGYFLADGNQDWALCSLTRKQDQRSLVVIKHVNNRCPVGYSRVAFLGNVYMEADGFDRSKSRYWMLCSLQKNLHNMVVLKEGSRNCPTSYSNSFELNSLVARADGFSFDPPRNWKVCSLSLSPEFGINKN